jgi:competence protein ComGC
MEKKISNATLVQLIIFILIMGIALALLIPAVINEKNLNGAQPMEAPRP